MLSMAALWLGPILAICLLGAPPSGVSAATVNVCLKGCDCIWRRNKFYADCSGKGLTGLDVEVRRTLLLVLVLVPNQREKHTQKQAKEEEDQFLILHCCGKKVSARFSLFALHPTSITRSGEPSLTRHPSPSHLS